MSQRKDEALKKLKQSLVFKGFSPKTIKSYIYNSEKFLEYLDQSSQKCDESSVKEYFQKLHNKNYDVSTIRLIKASLDFLIKNIFEKNFAIENIPYPKKKKTFPKVLSKEEIRKLIESENLEHKDYLFQSNRNKKYSNVQALLGHKSPETTLIYTHIASPNLINTKSPLESL